MDSGESNSEANDLGSPGFGTYPNFLVNQLPGHLHLLRGASDGEDAHIGVGVKRRVPLQLHVSSRLLVDVLNGLAT